MTAIRNGIIFLLACALPGTASAGCCGLFNPCGSPSWIGFSLALPVPRLPHLNTFCSRSCQSPLCGQGVPVGSCLAGHGCGPANACGCCPTPGFAPSYAPPLSSPPILAPQPTFPPTSCNPCEMGFAQTQMVPQQTISYREVPQIQYRQEAYTEQVPVTTYQQVTRYRSVPYQTMARIPQVSTQYVAQTSAVPCNPCLTGMATAPYIDTATAYAPTPIAQPQMNPIPEYAYPATQPQADAGSWQTIPQRQASGSNVQQMGYYYPTSAPQPTRRQSMFQPAPSAATAWQSRFMR